MCRPPYSSGGMKFVCSMAATKGISGSLMFIHSQPQPSLARVAGDVASLRLFRETSSAIVARNPTSGSVPWVSQTLSHRARRVSIPARSAALNRSSRDA